MTTTIAGKTAITLFASASVAASTPAYGTADMRTKFGGVITAKATNGATGPTVGVTATILGAPTTGSTPTGAAAGSDWKVLAVLGVAGTANNGVTHFPPYRIPPGILHVEIEFAGNTGQAVTCEAQIHSLQQLDS